MIGLFGASRQRGSQAAGVTIDLKGRSAARSTQICAIGRRPADGPRGASRERNGMSGLSRRSVLRSSLAAAAAGTLARPYIANAQAKTAELWWTQGFVPEEDVSIKKIVADYEKASGNKIE